MTKKLNTSFLGLLLFLLSLGMVSGAEETASPGKIIRISIRGTIDPATAHYLERGIHEAESSGAQLLLVALDTPGGLVSSTREMAQAIDRSKVPVVVFVGPAGASATSAGALLMISSHVAAMAPGTNIGAAHPVGSGGADIPGASGEKAVNDVSAFARGLAELRGRPVEIAGQVVAKSESFSAEEAMKAKLIDRLAPSEGELLSSLEGMKITLGSGEVVLKDLAGSRIVPLEMRFGETLLHYLAHPNVAAILMSLGLLLIYAELSSPGIGLPGVAGALCLLIAFIAFQAIPIREGALVLVALGGALVIAEFFASTGGILAVGGVVSFLLGLVWLVDPAETNLRIAPVVIGSSTLILGLGAALLVFAAARTRRLSAAALKESGGTGVMGLEGYEGVVSSVRKDGRAGSLAIRGERWNFDSEMPVAPGDRVRVVGQDQFRLKIVPLQ